MSFWSVALVVLGLGAMTVWTYVWVRGPRPAVYRHLGLTELEPFLRSWGAWLANRGVILVRHQDGEPTVQFRKRCYRRRGNILAFRYRNTGDSRRTFEQACAALQATGIGCEFELTRRRLQPRAITVMLDPADVLMPAAATKLIDTVFGTLGVRSRPEFVVWCEGRMAPVPDRDNVPLLPPTVAWRAGFRLGFTLHRVARAIGLSRS